MKLVVILGSTRTGRIGDPVARWVYAQAHNVEGWDVELVDIKQLHLPLFEEAELPSMMGGHYDHPSVRSWSQIVGQADAFIFVTPEYNHGLPAPLKNAIDWLYPEWGNKAAAIVSYSTGIGGGIRAAEQLRQVLSHLAVANVQSLVTIPNVKDVLTQTSEITEDRLQRMLLSQFIQLRNWAGALRQLRLDLKTR